MENEITSIIGVLGVASFFFELYFIHAILELKKRNEETKGWKDLYDIKLKEIGVYILKIESDIEKIKEDIKCLKQ
ncbi:hypothetical protein [uncultured Mediterranean phage uvMED]|nr:hypothetical protein [uncultured Mediterranean phage uvMED]